MNKLKFYFVFFTLMLFLSGCSNKQNEYYAVGKIKTEYIRKAPKTYLVNKFNRLGALTASTILKNGEMDGVLRVYYPSTHKIKGKVFYDNGTKTKMLLYNRSGKIIIKRYYDNRDKLDSVLRFMFETDFTLNKIFVVDSTLQMKISKARLQKFGKQEFQIINDSIINTFNQLNKEKEEIGSLIRSNGFRKGSVNELLKDNSFEWEYVNDSLVIEGIIRLSTPVYFTNNNQDYVFIYISSMHSGAVGYGAFYLIRIKEEGFEVVREFPDFVV